MARRIPLMAGNWKMNKTVPEALVLARELRSALEDEQGVEIMVLPPFISLWPVAEALRGSRIKVGAQNAWYADAGAFTGEVSPAMLAGWCDAVLVGHSERRAYGEQDGLVNRKLRAALRHSLTVILAVGETPHEYEQGRTEEIVRAQLLGGLEGIEPHQVRQLVVAYEPVWAIGTGRAATPEHANRIIGLVREILAERFRDAQTDLVRALYGGSMSAGNTAELLAQPEIDGGLVGGASLEAREFAEMVRLAARAKAVPR